MPSNIFRLIRAAVDDPRLWNRILARGSHAERLAEAVAVSREMGFPVTEGEVCAALTRGVLPASGELSDTELGSVVGGKAVIGTVFNDNLSGGDGDDTLSGSLFTGIGNDTLNGGGGNDLVDGGVGDDSLIGGDGNDTLRGCAGADTLEGGTGNDSLLGGNDDDRMSGGDGFDTLWGGTGDDVMSGGAEHDVLYGEAGDDSMSGDGGDDRLEGAGGDDTLDGGDGRDTLLGGWGEDSLSGGDGNDFLLGDSGEDTLVGGAGNDQLTGGESSDLFVFGGADGDDSIFDFEPDRDHLQFDGIQSRDQLGVSVVDGNTVITYGDTTVTIKYMELSADQVWNSVANKPG